MGKSGRRDKRNRNGGTSLNSGDGIVALNSYIWDDIHRARARHHAGSSGEMADGTGLDDHLHDSLELDEHTLGNGAETAPNPASAPRDTFAKSIAPTARITATPATRRVTSISSEAWNKLVHTPVDSAPTDDELKSLDRVQAFILCCVRKARRDNPLDLSDDTLNKRFMACLTETLNSNVMKQAMLTPSSDTITKFSAKLAGHLEIIASGLQNNPENKKMVYGFMLHYHGGEAGSANFALTNNARAKVIRFANACMQEFGAALSQNTCHDFTKQ